MSGERGFRGSWTLRTERVSLALPSQARILPHLGWQRKPGNAAEPSELGKGAHATVAQLRVFKLVLMTMSPMQQVFLLTTNLIYAWRLVSYVSRVLSYLYYDVHLKDN